VSNVFGKPVDLGPNWMHGDTLQNSALMYFKDASVVLHDIGSSGTIFSPSGTQYSLEKVNYIEEFMWEYVEEAIEYSKAHAATIDPDLSLYTYVEKVVTDRYPDNAEIREQILMATRIFGFYIGEDVTKQSLKFAFLEEPSPVCFTLIERHISKVYCQRLSYFRARICLSQVDLRRYYRVWPAKF
jgi:hypothetical protein